MAKKKIEQAQSCPVTSYYTPVEYRALKEKQKKMRVSMAQTQRLLCLKGIGTMQMRIDFT